MASGTDVAIAVGTIATAGAAVLGLFVSLYINRKDNEKADARAAGDRAVAREDAERRHIVGLLLDLGRQVARQLAYRGSDASRDATQQITLLLNALPAECAHTVRQLFDVNRPMAYPGCVGLKVQHLGLNAVGANASAADMNREIAFDIDRYLTSGRAPSDVWTDMDDLIKWMRERWPH